MNNRNRNKPPSPSRLYRDRDRGLLAGVCAGLADYLGFNVVVLRLVALIMLIPFTAVTIVGYLLLWWLIPLKPTGLYASEEEETFWREVKSQPRDSLGQLRHRFRNLERRLQRMETWVTSKEYEIDRELR